MEGGDPEGQFEYLVSEYGWQVRSLVEEDDYDVVRKAAQVHTEAFYVPMTDPMFPAYTYSVFKDIITDIRIKPPQTYSFLIAEPIWNDGVFCEYSRPNPVVGIAEVALSRDEGIVQHMEGAEGCLYLSDFAVLMNRRRQKVATAILQACDILCIQWGLEYLALNVDGNDVGACKCYQDAGFRIVKNDHPKPGYVLMIKRCNPLMTRRDLPETSSSS